MPNWTKNEFTVRGSRADIERLLNDFCESGVLSFDKIAPKPEGFDGDLPSGTGDESYDLLHKDRWKQMAYPWIPHPGRDEPTREDVIKAFTDKYESSDFPDDKLRAKYPTYQSLADAYKRNIELTGCRHWYAWNNEHWGTKWEPCHAYPAEHTLDNDCEEHTAKFVFDTAWCEPEPIYARLRELFPATYMKYVATHEGDDQITGRQWFPEESED